MSAVNPYIAYYFIHINPETSSWNRAFEMEYLLRFRFRWKQPYRYFKLNIALWRRGLVNLIINTFLWSVLCLLCRCVVYSIEYKYYLPFVCCTIFFLCIYSLCICCAEREKLTTAHLRRTNTSARGSARHVHARTHVRMHHRARERWCEIIVMNLLYT